MCTRESKSDSQRSDLFFFLNQHVKRLSGTGDSIVKAINIAGVLGMSTSRYIILK